MVPRNNNIWSYFAVFTNNIWSYFAVFTNNIWSYFLLRPPVIGTWYTVREGLQLTFYERVCNYSKFHERGGGNYLVTFYGAPQRAAVGSCCYSARLRPKKQN